MKYKIIADSCCDTTRKIREELDLELVPLRIFLSQGKEYIDTLDLDITSMLDDMKLSQSVKTTCPSIDDYLKFMYKYDNIFVITLANFLSGSCSAAIAARDIVLEEFPEKKIHVFDSLNASAGELNLVLYIDSLIKENLSFEEIIEKADRYLDSLATIFVLEDIGNMIKNGRINKITGMVATLLNIYPVLYKLKVKEIHMAAKVRGLNHAFERMIELIAKWTAELQEKSINVTLSHCEALSRAETLREKILISCKAVLDVIITPTSGLSSVYANRGGIIVSFQTVPV